MIQGNLLTLPVGQGMLYVQPVYVQSSGSTQFPLLRRVLVAFGDEIGFAQTLDEALDQVFQGDSGANAGDAGVEPGEDEASGDGSDEGTGDGSGQDGGDGSGSDSDAQQRLNQALADAAQAMEESSTALADGDWAAYGDAQDRLNAALAEAIEAEEELTGQSITGDGSGDEGATEEPTDGEG